MLRDLGLEINPFVALLDALVQRTDDVAVRAGDQAVQQFHDGDLRAERVVHGRHLEADDAAADDQQALRDVLQLERAGRIHQARIVVRKAGNLRDLRAGGDDAGVERNGLLALRWFRPRPCAAR